MFDPDLDHPKEPHSKTEQFNHEKKEKIVHPIHESNLYCDDQWKENTEMYSTTSKISIVSYIF